MTTFAKLKDILEECRQAQLEMTAAWHEDEPGEDAWKTGEEPAEKLFGLCLEQHWANFSLWHVEDEARRTDVGDDVIADCKRRIDALNQKRNDLIERMDECLVAMIVPLLPENAAERYNTETIGSALDRMSILSLKIFHMQEQVEREDVDEAHRENCARKAEILRIQNADLCKSAQELVDEYAEGLKRPKVYFQFKMYNDPNLNPALYKAGKK